MADMRRERYSSRSSSGRPKAAVLPEPVTESQHLRQDDSGSYTSLGQHQWMGRAGRSATSEARLLAYSYTHLAFNRDNARGEDGIGGYT